MSFLSASKFAFLTSLIYGLGHAWYGLHTGSLDHLSSGIIGLTIALVTGMLMLFEIFDKD